MNISFILNVLAVVTGAIAIGKTVQATLNTYAKSCIREAQVAKEIEELTRCVDHLRQMLESMEDKFHKHKDEMEQRYDDLSISLARIEGKLGTNP